MPQLSEEDLDRFIERGRHMSFSLYLGPHCNICALPEGTLLTFNMLREMVELCAEHVEWVGKAFDDIGVPFSMVRANEEVDDD